MSHFYAIPNLSFFYRESNVISLCISGPKTRISDGIIELRRVEPDLKELTSQEHKAGAAQKKKGSTFGNVEKFEGNADPLEMYAFSNGIALSVKLAIWEATLEEYVTSIEDILKVIAIRDWHFPTLFILIIGRN